ncbi:alpha/beta hydrolase [Natronoglomus mannanivorans]|uniref:Alpha/beta hydrolase n=1 Tax=Natronoglomus mannanivorans TaxID=2979990 RepID=A0AAP3E2S0_9EURY|nr:alpha/beta hydrolase [Halobacteria archaeon AArc-xg1-1]
MIRRGTQSELDGVDVAGPSDAQPIVFVHGAMFTRTMWAPQRDALSDEFRVIVPDLPGHGSRSESQFRLEPALELLDEVVETEADGNAILVGLSLGGYVSTAYAGRYPEKVDGLVISGCCPNPVDTMELLTRANGALSRLATRSDRIERGVERLGKRWVENRDLPRDVEREITDAGFYPKQFGEAGAALAGWDFRAAFAAYPGPTLILNGERDLVLRRGEKHHAAAAQDCQIKIIAGVGHVCNLHRPTAYTDTVRTFARRAVAEYPRR